MNDYGIIINSAIPTTFRSANFRFFKLSRSLSKSRFGVIQVLLSLGVPCWPRNDDGDTPYELALRHGHDDCADILGMSCIVEDLREKLKLKTPRPA